MYGKSIPKGVGLFFILGSTLGASVSDAAEGISPLQPGATTGAPAGALPPPGLYLMSDTDYESGYLYNGQGKTALTPAGQKIKASNISSVVALTWVPGWHVLGADYAMAIAQPYKWANTQFSSSGGSPSYVRSNGMVNTAITPVILSWNLGNGYFLGSGLTVYAKDAQFSYNWDASAGRNVKSSNAIGNNYWTMEPNIALSYLNDGWGFTLNNILDFNTVDQTTDYRSGMTYYLDATLTKRIDNYTVGLLANYTRQITDDKIDGQPVAAVSGLNSEGNRMEHVLAGPLLAYDFGSFTLTGKILFSLRAENDANVSFYHIGITIPIK